MEECVQNSKGKKNIFSPFYTQLNYLSAMKIKENSGLKSFKRLFSHVCFSQEAIWKCDPWKMRELINPRWESHVIWVSDSDTGNFQVYEGKFQSCSYITGPESKTFAWIKIMEAEKLSESYLTSYLIHLTVWTIVLRIWPLEPRHLSKRGQRGRGAIINPNNIKMFIGKEE